MTSVLSDFYATRFRRGTLLICVAHLAFFSALFIAYFYLKATVERAGKIGQPHSTSARF